MSTLPTKIGLSEISQAVRDKYHMISSLTGPNKQNKQAKEVPQLCGHTYQCGTKDRAEALWKVNPPAPPVMVPRYLTCPHLRPQTLGWTDHPCSALGSRWTELITEWLFSCY